MRNGLFVAGLAIAVFAMAGCEKPEEEDEGPPPGQLIFEPTSDGYYTTPNPCVELVGDYMRDERYEEVSVTWHNEATGESGTCQIIPVWWSMGISPYEIQFSCVVPLTAGVNRITMSLWEPHRTVGDWICVTCEQ